MSYRDIFDGAYYCRDAQAVIVSSASPDMFQDEDKAISVTVGKKSVKVAPWGKDNDLPVKVQRLIAKNDVVGSNLQFNIQAAYGLGIKPMERVMENGQPVRDSRGGFIYRECIDERVLEFFEDNDIDGYFLEQITDLMTYFNVFPEIVLNKAGNKILSLRSLEAVFSRFGSIVQGKKEITRHLYGDWENGSGSDAFTMTPVLPRFQTYQNLIDRMAERVYRDRRFVLQVSMPTPGRLYYARPYWWSIFQSGWYDISEMLPRFKKQLINNHLAVKYIVYISDSYWKEVYKRTNTKEGTEEGNQACQQAAQNILDFLVNERSKGGGLISTVRETPTGSGKPFEDKYVRIETVDSPLKGGEFIEDAEEASNIISYAMGVHPDLNGATPGKSKGSLGGSNKRELFMIKQALMRPFRDRLLKPLNLIKRFNGWPDNLVFAVPEYVFTTLDQNRNGKAEVIQSPD